MEIVENLLARSVNPEVWQEVEAVCEANMKHQTEELEKNYD